MLVRLCIRWNSSILLVGKCTGTASMENSVVVSQKIITAIQPSNLSSEYIHKGNIYIVMFTVALLTLAKI